MNKHVVGPTLGLLVLGTMSLAACSGAGTARSAAAQPSGSPSVTASSSASSSSPDRSVGTTAPAARSTAGAATPAAGGFDDANATYASSCDRTDLRQVPVRLHDGKAVLPHRSELQLDERPIVTKDVRLQDGHTYRLVTLDCLPAAGASHSQLFVYRADPGTAPRLLGEPIKVADQVRITTTGEQDHEGLVVSAEGWSAKAPGCCPDRSLTYFMTVTAGKVVAAQPVVQPLTR